MYLKTRNVNMVIFVLIILLEQTLSLAPCISSIYFITLKYLLEIMFLNYTYYPFFAKMYTRFERRNDRYAHHFLCEMKPVSTVLMNSNK